MGRSSPVHKHDLRIREKGEEGQRCGGCGEEIPGQMSYYWCAICRYYFHEKCAKLALEIKHFFHPCPLFLRTSPRGFICNSCFGHRYEVLFYRCERCDFDMCLECTSQALSLLATSDGETDRERILHCCHRHPLQPVQVQPKSLLCCQICDMPCSSGPTWGCSEPCNFHLHKPCLDFLPQIVHTNLGSQAASWVLITTPFISRCIDCDKLIDSSLVFRKIGEYRNLCIFCCLVRRLIEESSSQIPKVINHSIHPCPNLKLILSPASSTCNACLLSRHPFSYHCKPCDFFLCLDCAQLPHFPHWHPLMLLTDTKDNHACHLCDKICSEPSHSCIDLCQFYIHKSCMDSLPHRTSHLVFNPTVVLLHVHSFECTTCNHQCSGLAYYCSERKCVFCVKCVLWPENVLGDDGRFKSTLHWHQLSLCETRPEHKRRRCFLCKELCIPWTLTYKCGDCNYFFHKSCAELPAELDHPLHPHHRLTLLKRSSSLSNEDMICKLCLKSLSQNFPLYDVVYRCQQCDFQLDTQCATNCLPSVEYKGHPHRLLVVVNMHGNPNCQVCSTSCKGSSTFRCAEKKCDFTIHLQCGPLPRTVKHACHVHPLILKDYYVEDNISDEFACHICEEERDPRLRVYCCLLGCLMVCDVNCMLNEVLPLLRGERGEVELRTPFPQVQCRVITNKSGFGELKLDFITQGVGVEIEKNKHVFSYDELGEPDFESASEEEETDKLGSDSEKEDESSDEDANNYSFSWQALSHFGKSLRPLSELDGLEFEKLWKQYDGDIVTGAHALPEILDSIYKEFFGMYNINEHKCKLSYEKERLLIFVTVCVLHQMRIVKVVDVAKETIQLWLAIIREVKKRGKFNVGFIAKNIEQVWKAHYYIQAKKIVDDETSRLDRKLEQVSMYEAELRTKLDEAKEEHQNLKLMADKHDAYTIAGARGPMKKARSEALEIKWRTCYESIITHPGNAPAK